MSTPGRADTPEKKRAVVEAVLAAWLCSPDQRLGQLISNGVTRAHGHAADIFYAEDDELVAAVCLNVSEGT